jgi:uncharacterized coiled-coil DUF342 family protein
MPAKKDTSSGNNKQSPNPPANPSANDKNKPVQQKEQPKGQQRSQTAQEVVDQGNAYRKRTPSTDPGEEAILLRMDAIQDKINLCKNELDKIKNASDDKRSFREVLFRDQDALRNELKELENKINLINEERQRVFKQLQEARRVKKLKWDEANKFKAKLATDRPFGAGDDDDDDTYNRKLEEQIKKLEGTLSAQSVSLAEEKKLVSQIDQLQQAKKYYKEYKNMRSLIKQDDIVINELKASLEKVKVEFESLKANKDELKEKLNQINTKITNSKADIPTVANNREQFRIQLKQLQDDLNQERNALQEYRNKRNEEKRERIRQEREKERQRRTEQAEKRKEKEAERQKKELLQVPYQDEMDLCDKLISYLESLLPKKQDAAASSVHSPNSSVPSSLPNAPEGYALKKEEDDRFTSKSKKQNKKTKSVVKSSQDLKHVVDVFLEFETLSLAPPSKASDVEASIILVRAKKEHYQKLSEAKIKQRQDNDASQNAANPNGDVTTSAAIALSADDPDTTTSTTNHIDDSTHVPEAFVAE